METIGVTSVSFSNNKNLIHDLKLSHPKAKSSYQKLNVQKVNL